MASLFDRIQDLAKSPKAREVLDKAKEMANDPKNKEKVQSYLAKFRKK
ncbi:type IV secretory pathway VirB4 component [Actinoalloteichus hoggarensis]|uniref:Uncharacterized protein n=1 Tax=Actinoalloteichus hoggarensis TaxID=1470176 RepID=A0A221W1B2_9PSEU|nr:hypothetical protein [Actinoalloteichus hoggarensis]ASO19351.1 hypothetical protein AHOG_08530 [Actinoalloteichus hoggarensis]MBB5920588.1 type IV secretory pathway VirB4 component [Actinoalloteichus hoggarensis]